MISFIVRSFVELSSKVVEVRQKEFLKNENLEHTYFYLYYFILSYIFLCIIHWLWGDPKEDIANANTCLLPVINTILIKNKIKDNFIHYVQVIKK